MNIALEPGALTLDRTRSFKGGAPESRVLTSLARQSVIAVLRYAHLRFALSSGPKEPRVLSAGCGKALAELALALEFPSSSWVCVDNNEKRYSDAQAQAERYGAKNISFSKVDLDAADEVASLGSFDLIIANEVAVYLADVPGTYRALWQLLSPGGRLINAEPFLPDDTPVDRTEELRQHIQGRVAGFSAASLLEMARGLPNLKETETFGCFWSEPTGTMRALWDLMKNADDWTLAPLLYDLAMLDIRTGRPTTRREAGAVGVRAMRANQPRKLRGRRDRGLKGVSAPPSV